MAANLNIQITGDGSGAQRAFDDTSKSVDANADAIGAATEKYRLLSEWTMKAASSVLAFAKESLAAYEQQERADRQLKLVAGELTDEFKRQAEVMEKTLGVQSETVQGLQTMLLRYGAAPAEVEKTTRAVLDFAAATGRDAQSAMFLLTKGIETGGASLAKLGIRYTSTGDTTKDLALATQALAEAYGGAAEADAHSLAGKVRIAESHFDDLKKAFGGFIAEVESNWGVLDKLKLAMEGLVTAVTGGDEQTQRYERKGKLLDELNLITDQLKIIGAMTGDEQRAFDLKAEETGQANINRLLERRVEIERLLRDIEAEGRKSDLSGAGESRKTTKGGPKTAKGSGSKDDWKSSLSGKLGEEGEQGLGDATYGDVIDAQLRAKALEEAQKLGEEAQESFVEAWKQKAKDESGVADAMGQVIKDLDDESEAAKSQMAALGESLGASLVNAMTNEIAKIGAGGEFDIMAFIGGLLPIVGGALFGPLGAAVGGMAGAFMGLGRKRHDGGWIEPERFHGGGWSLGADEQPAILQTGERVLSRREVAAMGGPSGVDRAATAGGGPSVVVNISGLDVRSTKEFMEDRGGRGFADAIRSGRGDVARLFGRGRTF